MIFKRERAHFISFFLSIIILLLLNNQNNIMCGHVIKCEMLFISFEQYIYRFGLKS